MRIPHILPRCRCTNCREARIEAHLETYQAEFRTHGFSVRRLGKEQMEAWVRFKQLHNPGVSPTPPKESTLPSRPGSETMGQQPRGKEPREIETPSITCPTCGRTSYHPQDVRYGYCGFCNDFTGAQQPELPDLETGGYA